MLFSCQIEYNCQLDNTPVDNLRTGKIVHEMNMNMNRPLPGEN